jgi:hypothetical protein
MSDALSKEEINSILSKVPVENGFLFQTDVGRSTNVTATSLEDLAEKLTQIDVASIDFHYPRGDFQAWIRDTLKDPALADRMCFVQRGISGEKLRHQLLTMVNQRIKELKEKFPSIQCNSDGLCLS